MNLSDSIQYKSHSVHSLFEPMHGYILSITFGNAIDFHSMGLVNRKKNLNRIKSAIETPFYTHFDFYRTAINYYIICNLFILEL